MSSPAGQINYARAFGIKSVAAAAVFAVLYAFLLPYYIFRAFRNPSYVLIVLSLFCAIRVTAFVMRAVLAGSSGAASNLGLVIGESIVYSVGFFGLLYSTYTLVLDREIVGGLKANYPLSKITSNRHVIRLALTAAVVVGITGSTFYSTTNSSDLSLSNTLRKVSIIIFLVVTALLVIHTLFLVREERAAIRNGASPFGSPLGMYTLCIIVILLLIREIYLTATINKIQSERSWYPLAALPELLAVCLFAVPNLIPDKREYIARTHGGVDGKRTDSTEMA